MYQCYRVISSPRLKACSMGDRHSQLCYYESRGGGGVTHDFFARGVSLYGLFLPFLEFLTKSGALFGIFVPIGGPILSKIWFRGLFWEKMAPIFKPISKIVDFFVQTRWKSSVNSVFIRFVICSIKITDSSLWKIDMPFSEFFLENMTLTRGTLTCTLHMEAPPPWSWMRKEVNHWYYDQGSWHQNDLGLVNSTTPLIEHGGFLLFLYTYVLMRARL